MYSYDIRNVEWQWRVGEYVQAKIQERGGGNESFSLVFSHLVIKGVSDMRTRIRRTEGRKSFCIHRGRLHHEKKASVHDPGVKSKEL